MKPDILERLLMDRALGRLDPDTEVALADYLAKDPAAATQARELQENRSARDRSNAPPRARRRDAEPNPSACLATPRRTGARARRFIRNRHGPQPRW